MAPDPACCVPGDSVAMAAQIMKSEDVGPVLVVSDHMEKRLVGVVTDRDLVIKVIAAGLNPNQTRIDTAMSAHPVSCRAEDDVSFAMRLMSLHQVRRIPVVDELNRLVGIVAQADLARHVEEEEVGGLVEDISQPFGADEEWIVRGVRKAVVLGALCLGAGLRLAYWLGQPRRGSRHDYGY